MGEAEKSRDTELAYEGNDRLLLGLILAVLGFWLFAQTTLNIGPVMAGDLGITPNVMNIAVSITTLFGGIFMVVFGGLGDRLGRVKMLRLGILLSVAGSLLIGSTPTGALAEVVLMTGRILQGLAGAFIMPASMALVKDFWQGADRQRAISLWSMGSWGGNGFAALFGGLMAEYVGWRWIFFLGAIVSFIGFSLITGTPESKAPPIKGYRFDTTGVLTFMVMMVSLQVVLTQGGSIGWFSPITIGLLVLAIVFAVLFFRIENNNDQAFVDFSLFKIRPYTGATLSNFLLNATAGIIVIAMSLMQMGASMTALEAGFLTLGYAVVIVSFIRVGEKLLQRFGPRKPMLWGSLIVGVAIIMLMPTNVLADTYRILAVIAFSLFGLGLAFYATPSTDVALSNLPAEQSGSGSGIYKMAASLGSSFGVAISATIFTAMSASDNSARWISGLVAFEGRQDNIATREAALAAYGVNLIILIAAVITIMATIPAQSKEAKTG